jgi:hypothetical protein
MTFSTSPSPGVTLQGGGSSGGGGAASLPISGNGATITASTPLIDGTQTWSNAAVTFTGAKLNITDTASNAASLLMDLQRGGVSQFSVRRDGIVNATGSMTAAGVTATSSGLAVLQLSTTASYGFHLARDYVVSWGNNATLNGSLDLILSRRGAANLRLGAADAAAPVAQTLSVQSGVTGASATTVSISGTALTIAGTVTGTIAIGHAVTGTGVSAGTLITAGSGTSWTVNNSQTVGPITAYFNSVGRDFTITGNQASGPSAGGSIVFQVAPAGAAATTAQNALATALTIAADANRTITFFSGAGSGNQISLVTPGYFAFGAQGTSNVVLLGNSNFSPSVNLTLGTASAAFTGIYLGTAVSSGVTSVFSDAANTLALRNGTAAQTFNVYGTFTDASNYERMAFVTGAAFEIQMQAAGTGVSKSIQIKAGSTSGFFFGGGGAVQWQVNSSGHLIAQADNTYDIGASGANRPRYIRAASALVSPSTTVASLPAAGTAGAGARSLVTDANATTFQSIVAAGGANVVPVYSDGTNWRIG